MEIEVVRVVQKVPGVECWMANVQSTLKLVKSASSPLLGCMFELLVVVAVRKIAKVRLAEFSFLLDDTNTVSLTVRQITR